jgi:hypothetical protein
LITIPQEKIPPPSSNLSYFFVYYCCILYGAVLTNFLSLNHFNMLEVLPLDKQQEPAHCEAVIERGLETFFEVGQAMAVSVSMLYSKAKR